MTRPSIPQDLEAEAALLGAMLVDAHCIDQLTSVLPAAEADRFYRPDHRTLFKTLVTMHESNKPMDIVLVEDELRRAGTLDDIGGRPYLIDLSEAVPSSANAVHYATIIRNKSLLRDLITAAEKILREAYADSSDVAEAIETAEKSILAVTERRIRSKEININALAEEVLHRATHKIETGLQSGYPRLDDLTGGFQPGELIVLAARPSVGKTALAVSLLDYIVLDQGVPSLFFSLEMADIQIAQRFAAVRSNLDLVSLRKGSLAPGFVEVLQNALDQFREAPLFLDCACDLTISEIRARARVFSRRHDIQFIVVDYLQLLHAPQQAKENRQAEVAAISSGLKSMARELRVPVLALSQLNRAMETEKREPRLSDLRESGAIEQDADVVLLLHRQSKDEPTAKLIVAKQRNGPIGSVHLHVHMHSTRFSHAAAEGSEDYGPRDDVDQSVIDFTQAPAIPPTHSPF